MYDLWKTLHVLTAAAWFGAGVVLVVVQTRLNASRDVAAVARMGEINANLGKRFFMPLAIATLVFGVLATLQGDISFGEPFITVGFLGVAASAVLGPTQIEPTSNRYGELVASRGFDDPETREVGSRLLTIATIDTAIIGVVVIFMVWKPFS